MPEQIAHLRPEQRSIETIIDDGTYHHLPPSALNVLLEHNKVIKFRRSSGWATVGIDPIRVKERRQAYRSFTGPDRRFYQ